LTNSGRWPSAVGRGDLRVFAGLPELFRAALRFFCSTLTGFLTSATTLFTRHAASKSFVVRQPSPFGFMCNRSLDANAGMDPAEPWLASNVTTNCIFIASFSSESKYQIGSTSLCFASPHHSTNTRYVRVWRPGEPWRRRPSLQRKRAPERVY